MNGLAVVIGQSINWIILILALITIGGFIWTVNKISKLRLKIDEDHRKQRGRVDYTPSGFTRNPDAYTWEDTLGYLEIFNRIKIEYEVFGQLVPIFPLLGILGTVAGLIQKLSNIGELQEALGLSLSTTFYGLIAAIILKVVDALWVSKKLNEMEVYFDTFEQNYKMARDKYLQENEEKN